MARKMARLPVKAEETDAATILNQVEDPETEEENHMVAQELVLIVIKRVI